MRSCGCLSLPQPQPFERKGSFVCPLPPSADSAISYHCALVIHFDFTRAVQCFLVDFCKLREILVKAKDPPPPPNNLCMWPQQRNWLMQYSCYSDGELIMFLNPSMGHINNHLNYISNQIYHCV